MNLNQIMTDLSYFIPEMMLTGILLLVILFDLFQKADTSIRSGYVALGGLILVTIALLGQDVSTSVGIFSIKQYAVVAGSSGLLLNFIVSNGSTVYFSASRSASSLPIIMFMIVS